MGASTSKEFEEAFGGLCVGSGRKQDVSKPHSDGDVKEATRARDLLDDSISFEEDVPKGEETLIIEAQSEEMAKLDKMLYHGAITTDDYAPKLVQIAAIRQEALEAKKVRDSPMKTPLKAG